MTQDQDRILRIRAVLQRTGLSRTTMYRKMQNGTFPKNIQISTRCAGWRESAVNEWMKNPMFYEVQTGDQARVQGSHRSPDRTGRGTRSR